MNKKMTTPIIMTIVVILLSLFVVAASYAAWRITKKQPGINKLESACLSFRLEHADTGKTGINLDDELPRTDFEGMQLEGYQFTVTNECDTDIDYRIDLNSLKENGSNYISDSAIAVLLDYGVKEIYSDLKSDTFTDSDVRTKKILGYDTVKAKETNTHTLRIWIDENAPMSEQNKTFTSNIEVTGGQGYEKNYTPQECFTFDAATNAIKGYDVACGGTDVVIPYEFNVEGYEKPVPVTIIDDRAFENKGLTSVDLPRGLITIDMAAFWQNPTLKKVIFRDTIQHIGSSAFAETLINKNTGLTFVMIPSSVTRIDQNAFSENLIEEIIIPDSVTILGTSAFADNKIKYFKIGTGITNIPNYLFSSNKITKLTIPDHITDIGDYAFANNGSVEIKLGAGVTGIGTRAFNSANYNTIEIPASVTRIDKEAFGNSSMGSTIIVRRPDSTGLTLGDDWSGHSTVIYQE